ncbi:Putative non-heme bromoperoxidase BpoC [Alphaproteobacteria bacterium SO-S41]|nr:Putative non-heme bromoperoxidase BpoC [Alphaproteobacteria bacterium SO-S41]
MTFAKLRDLDVYYERAGEGPPLLFIAGSGGDLRNRPNQMQSPLSKAFDLVSYDQRGLGQTTKPEADYTMADYADDAAALLDHLGWDRVRVMGASFGGMVLLELLIRHPQRVSRAVLACTSPGGAGGASYPFHKLAHLSSDERARTLIPAGDTRRDAAWSAAHPDEYAALIAMVTKAEAARDPVAVEGYRRQLAARAGHDTWDRLAEIACPVLIAAGRYDGIALPETQHNMAARIPGAKLEFFDGGHVFMVQDRAAFPAMIDFLSAA